MPLTFKLTKFSPLREVDLLMLYSCLLPRDQACLTVQSCTEYQRKNQRSWALHILGISRCSLYFPKFHIHRVKCMNIHYVSTFHMSHIALPYDHSRLRGCTVRSPLWNLRNTKYQFPIQFFRMPRCQVLNMLHENAFCRLHTPPPYLMFNSTFLQSLHWNLGPGFISISPANINNTTKLVPCEGLKVLNPSEVSGR